MTRYGHIEIPDEALAELCRRYDVRELALFGSALTDQFRPESDIDLLVEFEPGAVVGMLRLGGLKEELENLLGRPVDIVPKRGLKRWVREEVLPTAQTVYAA
jgi:predicted nucleotidyltransferase